MTVSDVIGQAIEDGNPVAAEEDGRGVPAGTRARVDDTDSDGKGDRLRAALATVRDDVAGAWLWRGAPPTLVDLWRNRVPDISEVPGGNRPLHVLWVVYNHLVLIVFPVLAIALWVLQHPARFLLAAAIAGPLIGMWIS